MGTTELPGFSAAASRHDTGNTYRTSRSRQLRRPPVAEGSVVPQQECFTFSGKCTGFWPWYQGTQCVTGLSGQQQCCTSASTYPALRECRNPDGSWREVSRWCGYCWW
jgi:hypothetical protein